MTQSPARTLQQILVVIIVVAVALTSLYAVRVYAATTAGGFCEKIDDIESNQEEKLSGQLDRLTERYQEKQDELIDRSSERGEEIFEKVATNDSKRASRSASIIAGAIEAGADVAVENFAEFVITGIDDRNGLIDDAVSEYENAVTELTEMRLEALEFFYDEYDLAVIDVHDLARSECAAAVPPVDVREAFWAELRSVKDDYGNRRDEYQMREEFQAARTTKNEEISGARQEYRGNYRTEKQILKEAF